MQLYKTAGTRESAGFGTKANYFDALEPYGDKAAPLLGIADYIISRKVSQSSQSVDLFCRLIVFIPFVASRLFACRNPPLQN